MTDPTHDFRTAAASDKSLRDWLLAEYGDQIGDDEQCLLDTLDGISDFTAAVDAALAAMADADSLAAAAKARATDLAKRASAASARSDRIRSALTWAMLDSGRQKVICIEATVSVKKGGKAVEITDIDELPIDLLRQRDPEPDKKAIKDAITSGRVVTGAKLVDSPATIQIRRS